MSGDLPKKIAIVGPESTGKSELAKGLSEYFKTNWVPEYAREYLVKTGGTYHKDDLLEIAKGQLKSEDKLASSASELLICDTNLLVIKIWSDFKYGSTDPWILNSLDQRKYDLYLLTNIDLPWKADPLREHPYKRHEIFQMYQKFMAVHNLPYEVISGHGNSRLQNAIGSIDTFMNS